MSKAPKRSSDTGLDSSELTVSNCIIGNNQSGSGGEQGGAAGGIDNSGGPTYPTCECP
ncbi:MAG TPA: hypothetical protein VI756_32075 [Blastocatellia bacterium]